MSIETQYAKPWDAPLVLDNGGAVLNIRHRRYGATYSGDDMTNPEVAIENALDDLVTRFGGRGRIVIPPLPGDGRYQFTDPAVIPIDGFGNTQELEIFARGAVLWNQAGAGILERLPVDMTEADAGIAFRMLIDGGEWWGDAATAGSVGLRIGAAYGLQVKGAAFRSWGTAVQTEFCLNADFHQCYAGANSVRNFVARHGTWTGATTSNSASNHTKFRDCRVYGMAGALSQFEVVGSSGCFMDGCIVEGENTVENIVRDSAGATTDKWFEIRNLHSENVPTGAIIRLKALGRSYINGLFTQGDSVMIDATGSGDSLIYIGHIPWSVATTPFKTANGGDKWEFIGAFDQSGQVDPFASALWVGGVTPNQRMAVRPSTTAEISGGMGLFIEGGYGIYTRGAVYQEGAQHYLSIATSQLGSGTVNEYNPTVNAILRLDPHLGNVDLTGITGGVNGRVLMISNVNATNNLVLKNENAGSAAQHRIITPAGADYTRVPGHGCSIWYDGTSSRWRILE